MGWSGTSPNGGQASGDFTSVVIHWSSAVLASDGVFRGGKYVTGPHLVLFGGGHNNYGGNELYAFGPLNSSNPSWARLTDPTIPAPNDSARNSSGYPVSRHSYDTLQYLTAQKKMLAFGAPAGFHLGNNFNAGDLFDFTVNPATTNPWSSIDSAVPAQSSAGYLSFMSGVDEATGYVWGIGYGNSAKLTRFDPATKTTTSYPINNINREDYCKAAVSSSLKIMVFGGVGNTVLGVDLRNPSAGASVYTISTTGSGPTSYLLSLEWDAVGGRFVGWNDSGRTLYFLTPSASPYAGGTAWAWSSVTPSSGATPSTIFYSAGPGNGRTVLGRMRIVNGGSWRGVVLMPNETTPLAVFRLS